VEIDFAPFLSILVECEENVPSDYEFLSKEIRNMISSASRSLEHGDFLDINLGVIGSITFPFFRYRTLTSLDLFSPEDLFLFSRYYRKYPKITNFIDVGMNIGLHSIVARNIGYSVVGFEPDPETFAISKELLQRNKVSFIDFDTSGMNIEEISRISNELVLINAAVSNFDGYTSFTKILDNPTANHLSGRKDNLYGNTSEDTVAVLSIGRFALNAIVKLDAEGEDYTVLTSVLEAGLLRGLVYLCDWRDETRKDIFDQLQIRGLSCYYPSYKKFTEVLDDLPSSRSCDFVEVEIK